MKEANIENLKIQYKGTPFRLLLKAHLKGRKNAQYFMTACNETILLLPDSVRGLCMGFIDSWLPLANDKDYWNTDASKVLTRIIDDADELLSSSNLPVSDEILFNMFQIVILSYAYSAVSQPKMRKFMGI